MTGVRPPLHVATSLNSEGAQQSPPALFQYESSHAAGDGRGGRGIRACKTSVDGGGGSGLEGDGLCDGLGKRTNTGCNGDGDGGGGGGDGGDGGAGDVGESANSTVCVLLTVLSDESSKLVLTTLRALLASSCLCHR